MISHKCLICVSYESHKCLINDIILASVSQMTWFLVIVSYVSHMCLTNDIPKYKKKLISMYMLMFVAIIQENGWMWCVQTLYQALVMSHCWLWVWPPPPPNPCPCPETTRAPLSAFAGFWFTQQSNQCSPELQLLVQQSSPRSTYGCRFDVAWYKQLCFHCFTLIKCFM